MSPKLLVIADLNMRQQDPCRVARCAAPAAPYFCPCLRPLLLLLPSVHIFFFYPPLPFSRSIYRLARCRKPSNVTSLIIGVVKRLVRNNYALVRGRSSWTRTTCVSRSFPWRFDVSGFDRFQVADVYKSESLIYYIRSSEIFYL